MPLFSLSIKALVFRTKVNMKVNPIDCFQNSTSQMRLRTYSSSACIIFHNTPSRLIGTEKLQPREIDRILNPLLDERDIRMTTCWGPPKITIRSRNSYTDRHSQVKSIVERNDFSQDAQRWTIPRCFLSTTKHSPGRVEHHLLDLNSIHLSKHNK